MTTSEAGQPTTAAGVFRRALRDVLVGLAGLAVVGVGVGAAVAGAAGAWGALLGVAVALVFSGSTVLTMLATARTAGSTTGAVVLGGWLAKMVLLVVVLVALRGLDFYDRGTFVTVLLIGVLGSAALDARAVLSARVPYTGSTEGSGGR